MISPCAAAAKRHPTTATKRCWVTATKWRNNVAMGASPWKTGHTNPQSPEGTTGPLRVSIHVAPSGLRVDVRDSILRAGSHRIIPTRPIAAKRRQAWAATKWRNDVAMGVSPWNTKHPRAISPEGTTEIARHPFLSPLRGLVIVCDTASTGSRPWLQHIVPSGLIPVATSEPKRWKTTAFPSPKRWRA